MPPAARLTDLHACPLFNPGVPPIPHVGGPICGPGATAVVIGGLTAAVVGDACTCVGPPDVVVQGSGTIFIGGKAAVRQGDLTAHGGVIVTGDASVVFGD